MADQFINQLTESFVIKDNDVTVYDILDSNTNIYNSRKVTFSTLKNLVFSDADNRYIPIAGGTMTGALTLKGDPTTNNEAANKAYVDSEILKTKNLIPTLPDLTGYLQKSGGTMSGKIILGPNALPVDDFHVVHKKFVIDTITALNLSDYIKKSSTATDNERTMALPLFLPSGDPTNSLHATNKAYVDAQILATKNLIPAAPNLTGYLEKSGGTMIGGLILSGNPININDAANKNYVDTAVTGLAKTTDLVGYIQKNGINDETRTMLKPLILNQNTARPSLNEHVVDKKYVDDEIKKLPTAVDTTDFLKKSTGGILNGDLTLDQGKFVILNTAPNLGTHAVNKSYLDTQINGLNTKYLPLSGGKMTGNLELAGNPVNANDAANRSWVLAQIPTIPDTSVFLKKTSTATIEERTMGAALILPSGDPSGDLHATNKAYVDKKFTEAKAAIPNLATYLPLAGGTMTGVLTLKGKPNGDNEAANKAYVDTAVTGLAKTTDLTGFLKSTDLSTYAKSSDLAAYLPIAGGTMTGALTLKGKPNGDNEAANKAYVDTAVTGLAKTTDLTGFLKSTDAATTYATKASLGSYTTTTDADLRYLWRTAAATQLQRTVDGRLDLKSFTEKLPTPTAAATGSVTLDLSLGNTFHLTIGNGNITEFVVTNAPPESDISFTYSINLYIKQYSAGSKTVTWSVKIGTGGGKTVLWPGGTAGKPTMTSTANAIDFYTITFINAQWLGFVGGQGFA